MKRRFRTINFKPETLHIIDMAEAVLDEWTDQGYTLTARQLYYQLFAKFPDSWIDREYNKREGLDPDTKNTLKNYKKLTVILSDARLAGLLDWDDMEDRLREAKLPLEFNNLEDRISSAIRNYRLPRWKDQDEYVELWTEKDALANIIEKLASKYHVPLQVNRGYSSQSAMYDAAKRIIERTNNCEITPVILYIGDHDPSGEDMVRDIAERLEMFGVEYLQVEKVALTLAQVKQFKLAPDPAKITDPRAGAYIKLHGKKSWEVDAFKPDQLERLIEMAMQRHVDIPKYNAWIAEEDRDKKYLEKVLADYRNPPPPPKSKKRTPKRKAKR